MRLPVFALSILVLAGCAGARAPSEPLVLGPFVGTLPCADCRGIATRLTLTREGEFVAEGTYRLEETYIDRGDPIVSTGQWTTLRGDAHDEDAVVYQIEPDHPEKSRAYVQVDDATIRLLDADMKEVPGPRALLKLIK
jgi:copper homeostasis protein (lipoprotein)